MQSVDDFLSQNTSPLRSVDDFLSQNTSPLRSVDDFLSQQDTIMPGKTNVTQKFDTYNPDLEIFSGGRSRDTNLSADMGTPVSLPPGTWKVERAYGDAPPVGGPQNGENQGYGNMIQARNVHTGDSILYEHLAGVNAREGQVISGGIPIAQTGASGNATGPNIGIEYKDPTGKLGEVLNSPYASYLPIIKE